MPTPRSYNHLPSSTIKLAYTFPLYINNFSSLDFIQEKVVLNVNAQNTTASKLFVKHLHVQDKESMIFLVS